MFDRPFVVCVLVLYFSCFSLLFTSSLPYPTCTLTTTSSPMSTAWRELTTAPSHKEDYCPMAIYHPPTGEEPNVIDDFHYSVIPAMIFQDEFGDIDTEPSYLCDAELDDETIGKALSSPHKLVTLMKKVCCHLSPFSHTHKNGETRTRT